MANDTLLIGTEVLARSRGIDAKAAREQVEAIKQIGYTTERLGNVGHGATRGRTIETAP